MLVPRALRAIPRGKAVSRYHPATRYYSTATMATPYHVQVQPADTGILKFSQNDPTASKVSELLQKDLEEHHVFFNASGFHNHIPHHLLTLYGTGATPEVLQKAFDDNTSYQVRAKQPTSSVVEELQRGYATAAPRYLGKGKHYADFLRFFQGEIERKGWKEVLLEYVFREGDDAAHDLFGRLYAGLLHPMIQLMFGIEWEQPAIVAEGLAQAAVHENRLGEFFTQTERRANERNPAYKPLIEFMEGVRDKGNEKLVESPRWDDPNRIYDGVMARAPKEALEYVSGIRTTAEELEERTAEMIHTASYVAAAAAFHPPNTPKFDFFIIHHLTSAPIFLTLNSQDWIPTSIKVRLLEWKMRLDIIEYVARGSPSLRGDLLRSYKPKDAQPVSGPRDLMPRFHALDTDGHITKTVRAFLIAQNQSAKYADGPWIRIRGDGDWLKSHYLFLDSLEGQTESNQFVRSAGFDEAWQNVPKAT